MTTYSAASSPVAGGRIASVPNDVVANVWTPTKGADGRIRNGSWANLPLNEWCAVSGAALSQIAAQLDAAGINRTAYDYGTSNGTIMRTIDPWTGVAVDFESADVWFPRGGGHADSSLNGVWRLNLERMGGDDGWYVEHLPSNPDATGFEWSSEYKTSGNFTLYQPYTTSTYDQGDILPDGKPTSSHTYGGVWFDPIRKKVGTSRYSRWQFNTITKTWERGLWPDIGSSRTVQIYGMAHWDEVRGRVVLFSTFTTGSHQWWAYDDATQAVTVLPGVSMGTTQVATTASARVGSDIWVFRGGSAGERYARFSMDSLTWVESGDVGNALSGFSWTEDACAACYVPEWGKILHYVSKTGGAERMRLFDPVSKAMEPWSQSGLIPPLGAGKRVHNKLFYYPRRKCVVLIDPSNGDAGYCIYLMRVG